MSRHRRPALEIPAVALRVLGPVVAAFVTSRLVTALAAGLGLTQLLGSPPQHQRGLVLEAALLWDGGWYLSLARGGYQASTAASPNPLAFPPLFPWLARGVGAGLEALGLLPSAADGSTIALAGFLISHGAFAAALVVLWQLVVRDHPAAVADRTVWLVAVFPLGVFWSAFYTESLFLLLAASTVLAARWQKWPLAGLLGALAVLTRWPGVLLSVVLFVEWLDARSGTVLQDPGISPAAPGVGRRWAGLGWIGLLPLTLGGYMLYLHQRFGNPLGMIQAHAAGWQETLSFFPQTYAEGVNRLWQQVTQTGPERDVVLRLGRGTSLYMWLDLGLPLLFVGLGLLGFRRGWLRPSDLAWLGLGIGFALSWNTTLSVGRYLMPLWPALVVGARLCAAHPTLERAWLVGSTTLLALTAYLFAHWQWVG